MNPILIVLIILAAVLLWFLLSFAFKPIGRLFVRLWEDAVDEIKENNTEKEKK